MTRQRATVTVIVIVLLLIGGFWIGWLVHGWATEARQEAEQRADEVLTQSLAGARAPAWAERRPCRPPTAEEQRQNAVALATLEAFDVDEFPMQSAAIQYFASGSTRPRDGKSSDKDAAPVCAPVEIYDLVAQAALRANIFSSSFLYEKDLALAEQIGPRDPKIVEAVARSAFNESIIPSDGLRADLRPYARLVLAELGAEAVKPWAQRALAEMSASDQMGTGAAQIAAASGAPEALAKVERLMVDLLAATPRSEPIPRETRNRLYELAYGLGMAGEQAQPYSTPLADLLSRDVESWAPPFGMIALKPAKMCVVARHIGGKVAATAETKDFCRAPEVFES